VVADLQVRPFPTRDREALLAVEALVVEEAQVEVARVVEVADLVLRSMANAEAKAGLVLHAARRDPASIPMRGTRSAFD